MSPLHNISLRGGSWTRDVSGEDVFHVDDPHALVMAAGYLKFKLGKEYGEGVYFRGQRKLYSTLEPTLYRGVLSAGTRDTRGKRLSETIKAFRSAGGIFASFGNHVHEPLLQHYGISTTWVDLVDNIWVALWFACHQAMSTGKLDQYHHFERRSEHEADGYAYILLIAADLSKRNRCKPGYFIGRNTELVDLRVAAPSVFLRPHAQHGLLFRSRGVDGGRLLDYSSQIRAVVRVHLRDALRWLGEGTMVGIHSLFPPPLYDNGYGILLDCDVTPQSGVGTIAHVGA